MSDNDEKVKIIANLHKRAVENSKSHGYENQGIISSRRLALADILEEAFKKLEELDEDK